MRKVLREWNRGLCIAMVIALFSCSLHGTVYAVSDTEVYGLSEEAKSDAAESVEGQPDGETETKSAHEIQEESLQESQEESLQESQEDSLEELQEEPPVEETEPSSFQKTATVDGVIITVSADPGVFPEGATLSVRSATQNEKSEIEDAILETREEKVNVAKSYTFDICVLDTEGLEIEPDTEQGEVTVSFKTKEIANENLNTEIFHILEEEGDTLCPESLAEVTDIKGTTAIAETESFSFYTVEFTYNTLQYSLGGEDSVIAEAILDAVGIEKNGAISAVTVSDSNYLKAEEINGEWTVTSLAAFTTDQWIKVTVAEIEYQITVSNLKIGNCGYPYGKGMSSSSATLSLEVDPGETFTFQWQKAPTKDGTYVNIDGATARDYVMASPENGSWYRCKVNDVYSKSVRMIQGNNDPDGRVHTGENTAWYVSNGTMAYTINGAEFDVMGYYVFNNVEYMLQTSYSSKWKMFSSTDADASPVSMENAPAAQLVDTYIRFSEQDDHEITFAPVLMGTEKSFAIGADTRLGNPVTTGRYADNVTLLAQLDAAKNPKRIAMMGAFSGLTAKGTEPAFTITPIDREQLRYWLGYYRSTYVYAYAKGMGGNTTDVNLAASRAGEMDTAMSLSWMNVAQNDAVRFRFCGGTINSLGLKEFDANQRTRRHSSHTKNPTASQETASSLQEQTTQNTILQNSMQEQESVAPATKSLIEPPELFEEEIDPREQVTEALEPEIPQKKTPKKSSGTNHEAASVDAMWKVFEDGSSVGATGFAPQMYSQVQVVYMMQNDPVVEASKALGEPIRETTRIQLGDGSLLVILDSVDRENSRDGEALQGVFATSVENVLDSCLTNEERKRVEAGENIAVRLLLATADETTVDPIITKQIQSSVKKEARKYKGLSMGSMVDISVQKMQEEREWEKMRELNGELELCMDIPEDLMAEGRTYFVLRDHEGNCKLLWDQDKNGKSLTIRTALFSTYAILYTDEADIIIPCYMHTVILLLTGLYLAVLWLFKKKSWERRVSMTGGYVVCVVVLVTLGICTFDFWIATCCVVVSVAALFGTEVYLREENV